MTTTGGPEICDLIEFRANRHSQFGEDGILAKIFEEIGTGPRYCVDDARDFNGTNGYPTIDQISAMVAAARPGHELRVEQDIIRITRRTG